MKKILTTFSLTLGLLLTGAELHAEAPKPTAESAIRAKARSVLVKNADEGTNRFCSAWRQLKLGMPFQEAEALGIEMNGTCTPGKPQSFHQPYMDLYFDAECRALHGATTLDC